MHVCYRPSERTHEHMHVELRCSEKTLMTVKCLRGNFCEKWRACLNNTALRIGGGALTGFMKDATGCHLCALAVWTNVICCFYGMFAFLRFMDDGY